MNFLLGAAVLHTHTLGVPVALTAVAFVIGLFVIPFRPQTRGQALPSRGPPWPLYGLSPMFLVTCTRMLASMSASDPQVDTPPLNLERSGRE